MRCNFVGKAAIDLKTSKKRTFKSQNILRMLQNNRRADLFDIRSERSTTSDFHIKIWSYFYS